MPQKATEIGDAREAVASATTVRELIAAQARAAPDMVAIAAPDRTPMSFARLESLVREAIGALGRMGVDRQRRVAIVLPVGPEAVTATLAVMSCAIAMPLNPKLRRAEIESALTLLDAGHVLAEPGSVAAEAASELGVPLISVSVGAAGVAGEFGIEPKVHATPAHAVRETLPSDVAVVMQTSGATGRPKRVPLTHANLLASAQSSIRTSQVGAGDRFLGAIAMYHVAGASVALVSLLGGSGMCCLPGFYGVRFLAWMAEYRPTWMYLSPPALGELLEIVRARGEAFHRGQLRFIRTGSASLSPSLMAEAEEVLGVPIIDVYGTTEASPIITCTPLPPRKRKPGSAGLPAGCEVTILGASDGPLAPGEVGEVLVRGPNVFAGYENDPEADKEAFWNGWFRTGDVGWLDEEGYLFLAGRVREMINRGGEKIFPREVEEALLAHPAILEAAVFPAPCERLSEAVAAAVVVRAGRVATEIQLRRFVARRLTDIKVPARILLVSEIPKGPGGKVQRAGLAAHFNVRIALESPSGRPPFVAPSTPIEQSLAEIWSRVLDTPSIGLHDDFFALGGDSFAAAELMAWVQKEFSASAHLLEAIGFLDSPTLAHMASVLEGAGPPAGAAKQRAHSWAIALQPRGRAPGLFMVPGIGSNPIYLLPLANRLGQERPFYALRDPRRVEERGPCTLEDMAEGCLTAIRTLQPRGPYLLAGHCFGGIIAFEIARKLAAQGETIALLVLFDTPAPHYPDFRRHWPLFAAELWRQFTIAVRMRQSTASLAKSWQGLRRHVQRRLARRRDIAVPAPASDDIIAANLRAASRFRPGEYPGRITILSSEDHIQTGSPLDRRLGWRELARGGIEVHLTPGGHLTTISDPYVGPLAERLQKLIAQSLA